MLLTAGIELEDVDAAARWRVQVLGTFLLQPGNEVTVSRHHEEVDFRLGGWSRAWAPTEMRDIIFDVEVEVAWVWDGFDLAAGEVAAAGFEGDERVGRHARGSGIEWRKTRTDLCVLGMEVRACLYGGGCCDDQMLMFPLRAVQRGKRE